MRGFVKKHLLFFCGYANIVLFFAENTWKRFSGSSHHKEVQKMAKCDICGKGVTFGIKVSHSHRRSNRTWKPNVKRVKAIVNGTPCHVYACTRCLRSGKVTKAV